MPNSRGCSWKVVRNGSVGSRRARCRMVLEDAEEPLWIICFHAHFPVLFWSNADLQSSDAPCNGWGKDFVSHSICLVCFLPSFYKPLPYAARIPLCTRITDLHKVCVSEELTVQCRRSTFTKCSSLWEWRLSLPEEKMTSWRSWSLRWFLKKEGECFKCLRGWRGENSRWRKLHFLLFFSQTCTVISHLSQNPWIFAKYASCQRQCRFAKGGIDWLDLRFSAIRKRVALVIFQNTC